MDVALTHGGKESREQEQESHSPAKCEQYTHKYSTYRVAQHGHFSSREHAWLKSSRLHIFVSLKQLSFTCRVSFFAAPDTDHQHKFSLTYLNTHKTFGTR